MVYAPSCLEINHITNLVDFFGGIPQNADDNGHVGIRWNECGTWPMKKEDPNRLEMAEHTMMRRMCGMTLRDRLSSEELYNRLRIIDSMSSTMTKSKLLWYGHVQRKDIDM